MKLLLLTTRWRASSRHTIKVTRSTHLAKGREYEYNKSTGKVVRDGEPNVVSCGGFASQIATDSHCQQAYYLQSLLLPFVESSVAAD